MVGVPLRGYKHWNLIESGLADAGFIDGRHGHVGAEFRELEEVQSRFFDDIGDVGVRWLVVFNDSPGSCFITNNLDRL